MKAIVDCNSFYCSCERVFRPDLSNKPIIVLSNNDGCIISRTDEAKRLGIQMAGPYFKEKPLIEKYNVATFSSNYNLYGDMSRRVMDTLKILAGEENVEIYSVDESFINISEAHTGSLKEYGLYIKQTVEQWTGVSVSVGIAPTKILAKIANHVAKKNKAATQCVYVLADKEETIHVLKQTPVAAIWGVGRRYAEKLVNMGITNAWELRNMSHRWAHQHMGGVTGMRLIDELRGMACIHMKDPLIYKKMIATTRMFGRNVTSLNDIKEAVATYTTRAAEKLRRQQGAATMIHVFIVAKEQSHTVTFHHGATISTYMSLPAATSDTRQLIQAALLLTGQIFKPGHEYKKTGVMLSGIVPATAIQNNLFEPAHTARAGTLMKALDNINVSMRDDIIRFGATGIRADWKMRREFRSPRYTSRWNEIREVG